MSCLGSEYVLASLGEHVLGVYSLTTAQLVAELALDLGAQMGREVRLLRAEAFALTRQHGIGTARGEGGDEAEVVAPGASLLAVALAAPRCCVTLLEVRLAVGKLCCIGTLLGVTPRFGHRVVKRTHREL